MKPNPLSTLGPVVRTFKSSRANLVAGVIIGLFLLGAGSAMIAQAPLQEPKALPFFYVAGAACLLGGLGFFAFAVGLAQTRVDLCEAGFRHYSFGRVDEVTWDEVEVIKFHASGKNDFGAHVDPYVTVLTELGETYCFTENTVTKMAAFVKVLSQLTSGEDNLWQIITKANDLSFHTPRRRNRKRAGSAHEEKPLPASPDFGIGKSDSSHVPPSPPFTPNTSEEDSLASHVGRAAAIGLAGLFRAKGHVVEQDSSWVSLPQWNARFRCQTIPGETPCVGPTIVIGVVAEIPELTAQPIIVYQLGAGSLCPTQGFADAIGDAVSQWYTTVWPVLENTLRFLRGEAIKPHSEWFQFSVGADPNTMTFPFRAFGGPLLVNSGETSASAREVSNRALVSQLLTWGLCNRVLSPLFMTGNELDPDQGVWWVKAYLGREASGEVFGEVKLNNENSLEGMLPLLQFPWPEEVRESTTFKQFFVIVRGKGESIPEPNGLELPSSEAGKDM